MKFAYRELEVLPSPASRKKRKVYRPIIPVVLISNKRMVGYEALVDSGADSNIFDAGVARVLGSRLTSGNKRQITGISGQKLKGYEHNIVLRVADKQYKTKLIFSKEMPEHSFGVLGNRGFFDHFKVNFDYRRKVLILT